MDFTFSQTNLTGGFWKNMQQKNRDITIGAVYDRFYETGRVEAMACKWKEGDDKKPHIFWDSDIAKWIEGASYVIAKNPDFELEAKIESIIDDIEANQWEDGYFNVYYTVVEPEGRFTGRGKHELYCAGHLIEAAVAYYFATGKDRFLRIMEKYVDLIYKVFAVEHSAEFDTPGHEEIELALLRLYSVTKNEKHLKLCEYFLNTRGTEGDRGHSHSNSSQSKYPVRELERAEGHSVRAGYLYSAMADFAHLTNDKAMLDACHRLYDDIVNTKMYITGGVGSTRIHEAYTVSYDLPNSRAYTETCAAISLMFFCQRLLENENKSEYADVIERIMYNGMISGLSLSGDGFFYENPLEIALIDRSKHTAHPEYREKFSLTERIKVFDCSCCAPNVNRVLASMERYFYHESEGTVYVDQFGDSEYRSGDMRVTQRTGYPVDGKVELCFEGISRAAIRIPAWCEKVSVSVPYTICDGYAIIEAPTFASVEFDMPVTLYAAHQEVIDDAGRVALMRGPIVYCAERVDNPVNLHRLCVNENDLAPTLEYNEEAGLYNISVNGSVEEKPNTLYSKASDRKYIPTTIKLIPFYTFANRGESDMLVWLRSR